jgi:hypothetical protein
LFGICQERVRGYHRVTLELGEAFIPNFGLCKIEIRLVAESPDVASSALD